MLGKKYDWDRYKVKVWAKFGMICSGLNGVRD